MKKVIKQIENKYLNKYYDLKLSVDNKKLDIFVLKSKYKCNECV